MKGQSLLSRLRKVVQKVRLLLSSAVLSRTWQVASILRRASDLSGRHLSFNDRSPSGLMICSNELTGSEDSASSPAGLVRTTSSSSSEDDIDKRAEMFINNFRRQLRMERQISLQLRYGRTDSFEISP